MLALNEVIGKLLKCDGVAGALRRTVLAEEMAFEELTPHAVFFVQMRMGSGFCNDVSKPASVKSTTERRVTHWICVHGDL
jgi:hypothetical protein